MNLAYCREKICAATYKVSPVFSRNIMRRGFTGLEGMDRRLTDAIRPQPYGYFVELGTNDGLCQSNTYKLQKSYEWIGLMVEPSPRKLAECVINRSLGMTPSLKCVACVSFDYEDRFVELEYLDLMSITNGLSEGDEIVMRHVELGRRLIPDQRFHFQYGALARTLTSLLEEVIAPASSDLLCVDVEGNELDVLEGLDPTRYCPQCILAECRDDAVPSHLETAGYWVHEVLSDSGSYRDILFRYP